MRTYRTLRKYALLGESGRKWYDKAQEEIVSWSDTNDVDWQKVSDITAITSQRVRVSRNIRLTKHYILNGRLPYGVLPAVKAALEHYEKTGEIRGPKTSAFASALKGNKEAIVLDVWMAKALDVPQETFGTKRGRMIAEEQVSKISFSLGWPPAEVQASIWSFAYERDNKTVKHPELSFLNVRI